MQTKSAKLEWEVVQFLDHLNTKWFLQNIESFSFEKWVCSMELKIPPSADNKNISINLARLFTQNWLNVREFERAMKVKEDLSKLREFLETESLFGWAVIVSYEQIDTVKKVVPTALAIASGLDIVYRVKKLMFRDELGKMQEVDPKIVRNILKWIWDKTRINGMIFRIMQVTGRVYNPIRSGFTDITTLGIDRATERVKSMRRQDIEKWRTMTDVEFESERSKMIEELAKTPRSVILSKPAEFLKWMPGKTMHYIFWWVFFAEYHKNTHDTANLYKGFADMGLFYAGANIGSKAAPGVWKMPASLLGGWLAVLGWHMAGWTMNLDKKMWRAMPERVAWDGTKSVVWHIILWGASNDIADRAGRDIGIPGTRGWATLYNPFGKDGIMSNVDFAETHITFGTNPREYLQSRIEWTDIHWNTRMDQYVSWATELTMKILQEYDNNRGYFVSSNGQKNILLRERLKHIFDSEDGKNMRNNQIIENCIEYVTTKLTKISDLNSRKELLSIFLGNYGNILKIDKDSLDYDDKLLERDKTIIDGQTSMYLSLISPDKRKFAEQVLVRLQKRERLVDGKITTHRWDMIGQEVSVFRPNREEQSLYQSLIDDATPVKEEWYDILWYRVEPLNFQIGINIPKSIVQLSWRSIYLDMGISFLANDYVAATDKRDLQKIRELDKWSGLNIASEIEKNPMIFQKSPFRGLIGEYFLLERLASVNPSIQKVLTEGNNKPKPTNGDIFVYLMNTQTEYREQKKFIDTQKSIGYANRWKFF